MGGKNLKSVNHYKYLGAVLNTELSDYKNVQRKLRYRYCAANKLRASFPDVQMHLKMYIFVPFVRPCMHHNYGGISESHACKDCVWPIILDAELYTIFPGERVLVIMTHQVQCTGDIPTFEALLRKNTVCTCFSKDAEHLITYGCLLWRSQIVYIRPYSLNTATAFDFVTECSNFAVFVRLRVCMSQCIRTLAGLDQFRN